MKPRKQMARTPIERRTPLRRTGGLKSSGPAKPHKRVAGSGERHCRDLIAIRSGGVCEVGVPEKCTARAEMCGHRKRRSQSSRAEKWSPTNTLHSCAACERHLTEHDTEASVRSRGWTVASTVDPARVPVLRRAVWVWLTDLGEAVPCDLTEIREWVGAA